MSDRKRDRPMEPETTESRSVSDAWAQWVIIDLLCKQLERSLSDSPVHRHAEQWRRVEMFPLRPEKVPLGFLLFPSFQRSTQSSCSLSMFLPHTWQTTSNKEQPATNMSKKANKISEIVLVFWRATADMNSYSNHFYRLMWRQSFN